MTSPAKRCGGGVIEIDLVTVAVTELLSDGETLGEDDTDADDEGDVETELLVDSDGETLDKPVEVAVEVAVDELVEVDEAVRVEVDV